MFIAVPSQPSCARAWVKAAEALIKGGDEGYNVIIDVENPVDRDPADNRVIDLVDSFLKQHDANPVVTVANTIFPQALYRRPGALALYTEYHKVYKTLTTSKQWGRYFERMTRKTRANAS